MPVRTSAWSSTMKTRMVILFPWQSSRRVRGYGRVRRATRNLWPIRRAHSWAHCAILPGRSQSMRPSHPLLAVVLVAACARACAALRPRTAAALSDGPQPRRRRPAGRRDAGSPTSVRSPMPTTTTGRRAAIAAAPGRAGHCHGAQARSKSTASAGDEPARRRGRRRGRAAAADRRAFRSGRATATAPPTTPPAARPCWRWPSACKRTATADITASPSRSGTWRKGLLGSKAYVADGGDRSRRCTSTSTCSAGATRCG